MSYRVDETLEVLAEIMHVRSRDRTYRPAHSLRLDACRVVAERRGIQPTTVSDKFRRQLIPHIRGTAAFDVAVGEWLQGDPARLRSALDSHAVTSDDRRQIRAFFSEGRYEPPAATVAEMGAATDRQHRVTVTLDADVAEVFPDSASANDALRALAVMVRRVAVPRPSARGTA